MSLDPQIKDLGAKVELSWTPDLDGQGYRYYVDGEAVARTFKAETAKTTFAKLSGSHKYGVQKMDVVDALEEQSWPAVVVEPEPEPTPEPPPASGDNVVLVNQKWSPPNSDWGHIPVVDVRIMDNSTRRDAVALAGKGTVGRMFIEQHSGDGIKIGQSTSGPIVIGSYDQQSEVLMYELTGDVHSDNCQAMGGHNVTFIGFMSRKYVRSNSVFFANEGSGGQGKPEDIVWTFSIMFGMRAEGDHRGGTPVKINDSIRCGIRHCLVVNSGLVPPLTSSAAAQNPIVEDSYSMTHADWDSLGGDGPRHRDLWNANGSHKPLLDQLIASGKVKKLTI